MSEGLRRQRETPRKRMAEVHGNRTSAENTGKTAILLQSGAKSGALLTGSAENDPNLLAIIEAWPKLTESTKDGIVAMVRSAGE